MVVNTVIAFGAFLLAGLTARKMRRVSKRQGAVARNVADLVELPEMQKRKVGAMSKTEGRAGRPLLCALVRASHGRPTARGGAGLAVG